MSPAIIWLEATGRKRIAVMSYKGIEPLEGKIKGKQRKRKQKGNVNIRLFDKK